MKVLVVLCAVVAGGLAQGFGYNYAGLSPLTGYDSGVAQFSYAYAAPIISASPYIAHVSVPVKKQYHSQDEHGIAQYGHDEPGQSHHAIQDSNGNKFGSFSYVDYHGGVHQTSYVADEGGYRVTSNDLPIGAAPAPLLHRKRRQAPWTGPPANVQVGASGHLIDTPEVTAAKQAHQAEVDRQSRQQPQQGSWDQQPSQPGYNSQPWSSAPAPAAAAPQQRDYSSLWSSAQGAAAPRTAAAVPTTQWGPTQVAQGTPTYTSYNQPPAQPWSQAPAARTQWAQPQPAVIPTVNSDGTLADTPEVARAKADHEREYKQAAAAAANAPETSGSLPAGPVQFPPQEDDGSYREGQYDAPSQQNTQSWGQQPSAAWPGAESRAWNQPQAAAPSPWSSQPSQATPAPSWGGQQQPQAPAYNTAPSWRSQQPQQAAPSWTGQQPQTSATAYTAAPAATNQWQGQWDQSSAPQSQSWQQPSDNSWEQPRSYEQSWGSPSASWNQQPQSGVPQDTPEVAAAKREHLQALAKAQG